MPSVSPVRLFRRLVPVLPMVLFHGCSDAPSPVGPSATARPLFAVGPTISVANTDDAGAGSLRQAIIDAPDGATIQFDAGIAGQTIVLTTGELAIDKALTIEAPVPAGMTISGGLTSRVFWIEMTGSAVLRNLSIVHGRDKVAGGMFVEGNVTLDHSLVANNEAWEGDAGGIAVYPTGELILVNSTVSGNTTPAAGGGIYSIGDLSIRNSTIAFNAARDDGGVSVDDGTFSLRNSIIARNTHNSGAVGFANCQIDPGVAVVLAGRNISSDDNCGTGPSMIVGDPELQPLAANGGPTHTHALAFGPAVDSGTACSEGTDQRYVTRNQGPTCDLGAFEFTDYGTITVAISPNVAVNAKTGVATVSGTIKCSAATTLVVDVRMSQTQKTTGKFTTIIQAQNDVVVAACGTSPSSWSALLTPGNGKFGTGSATGTASAMVGGFLPTNVAAPLKVFQRK